MSGLYIVAVVVRQEIPGATNLKSMLSWRWAESEDEAVGSAVKWALEERPGWCVASHVVSEIPADHLIKAVENHKTKATP